MYRVVCFENMKLLHSTAQPMKRVMSTRTQMSTPVQFGKLRRSDDTFFRRSSPAQRPLSLELSTFPSLAASMADFLKQSINRPLSGGSLFSDSVRNDSNQLSGMDESVADWHIGICHYTAVNGNTR